EFLLQPSSSSAPCLCGEVFFSDPDRIPVGHSSSYNQLAMSHRKNGIVTAPQSEAAFEGARVLDDGGNAADACVTAAFVQGIVDPHRCGVGGFGCSTISYRDPHSGEAQQLAIDFHGRAGGRAREDQWLERFESVAPDGFGFVVRDKVNDVGFQSVTVPGVVAGLGEIHRRFGSMSWGELIERAVPYAEEGFQVPPELAEFWIRPGLFGRVSTGDRLRFTEAGQKICFHSDGSTYRAGETFRQPELAETYRRIATEGPESLYHGRLAEEIAAEFQENGALVTAEDLANYKPTVLPVVQGEYRGHKLHSTPLPGGGVALLQALRWVEAEGIDRLEHNSPEYIDAVARVLQAVWHDRLNQQGDPSFGVPKDDHFLAPEYLETLKREAGETPPTGAASPDTTQLSVIDADGNAVSFSHSLGYNSGVYTKPHGILFNNCMSAFDPRPGHSNSIQPGKARSTAVAETIVEKEGETQIVLGSPGAARITAGLLQVLINRLAFEMNLAESTVQPRFDGYGPGTLLLESRFPPSVVRELETRGWNITQSAKPFGVVGRVYSVERSADGCTDAGVDPGSAGAAYRGGPR
ncbi:MAG: gamma-glutamyltransferase, partial [Planctomycetota bacterium]